MKVKLCSISVILVIIIGSLCGCDKESNYKKEYVYATITGKKYFPPYKTTTRSYVGTNPITITSHHDESFNVYVKYQECEEIEINNKTIYNKFKKGDKIKVKLLTKYKSNGTVKKRKIDYDYDNK